MRATASSAITSSLRPATRSSSGSSCLSAAAPPPPPRRPAPGLALPEPPACLGVGEWGGTQCVSVGCDQHNHQSLRRRSSESHPPLPLTWLPPGGAPPAAAAGSRRGRHRRQSPPGPLLQPSCSGAWRAEGCPAARWGWQGSARTLAPGQLRPLSARRSNAGAQGSAGASAGHIGAARLLSRAPQRVLLLCCAVGCAAHLVGAIDPPPAAIQRQAGTAI